MSEIHYIGRHPILNAKQEIYGYELLFRTDQHRKTEHGENLVSTAKVLIGALVDIGLPKLLGNKMGFVNINEEFIDQELYINIPSDRFIFEIVADTKVDFEFIKKIITLKKSGYLFALDNFIYDPRYMQKFEPLYEGISIVKVDLRRNSYNHIQNIVELFSGTEIKLLAEKVEIREEFLECKERGFLLFQGHFYSRPSLVDGKKIDVTKSAILKLVRLIQNDLDINEIENIFKSYSELTITLLKFINSASIFVRNRIVSIRQAITLLGYQKLLQWLLLLSYSQEGEDIKSNPLFRTASQRGKSMENLVGIYNKEASQLEKDEAFLVGLLSLLDVLMQAPMEEVLKELNLSKEIENAILHYEGWIGKLLRLVIQCEQNHTDDVDRLLEELHIPITDLHRATMASFWWAENISNE